MSVSFLALLLLLVAGVKGASAQQADGGFQVSPLRYDWQVNLNDQKTGTIFVKNNSSEAVNIEVDAQDFSVNQDLGNTSNFFVPNENHPLKAYDVINWINIDKAPFRLEAGQSKEVTFSAKIPAATPTGGYYGVIFFSRKPVLEKSQTSAIQINTETRLGVLLTFAVKGNEAIVERGDLKLFEASKNVFIDNPITFNLQMKNTGNIPYKVFGSVDISKFGSKLTSLEISPNLLYPDRVRGINIVPLNLSIFDIGKYNASLHLTSEDGAVNINSATSFVVIPWKLAALAFLIFVALWVVLNTGIINGKAKVKSQSKSKAKSKKK